MKRKDLIGKGYRLHHSAYTRGYVSRKTNVDEIDADAYRGRFGVGYVCLLPCYCSTNFCRIEYWTREETNERRQARCA